MAPRYQKYRLKWPITPTQWINVDEMFSEIYTDLATNALSVPTLTGDTSTQIIHTIGDLMVADTTSTFTFLHDVAIGNVLLSGGVGVSPSYGKVSLTAAVSGVLAITNGGTGNAVGNAPSATVLSPGNTINGVLFTGGSPITITAVGSTVTIIDDTSTNATMYPVWVPATPGNEAVKTSSTELNWNPSTSILSIGSGSTGKVSIHGQLIITNTQLDSAIQTIAATVIMPTVITTTRSAFNFDVTTAGSSSFITQGMVFTMEAGYTGSSAVKAFVAQSGVATTGFAIGLTSRMVGAAGVNIGVNSFCDTSATQNIALFGGLGNTDGSTFSGGISSCLVLANGTTTKDLIQAYSNVTKKFSVTDSGNLTVTGQLIAGAASFVTWNGLSVMSSPANGQINLTNQAITSGVGFDVTTDALLKIRTRAQTGDANISANSISCTVSGVGVTLSGTSPSIQMSNQGAIQVKDSGGTVRNILQLDNGNQLNLVNQAGNVIIVPGSTAKVRIQNNAQTVNGFEFLESALSFTFNNPGIINVLTDSIIVQNATASTALVPVQISPSITLKGHVWNTTTPADNSASWSIWVTPVSGATPSSGLNFSSNLGNAITMQSNGSMNVVSISLTGSLNIGTQILIPNSAPIRFGNGSGTRLVTAVDGQLTLSEHTATAGVGFDILTNNLFRIRTIAQTGDASISSLNHTTSGTLIDTSYNIATPATLATVVMSANQQRQIINPAGTIAVLTVTLPSSPVDGQIAGISFTQIVSALTVNAPGGATVVQAPTSAAVDTNYRFIYQASSTSWFPAS